MRDGRNIRNRPERFIRITINTIDLLLITDDSLFMNSCFDCFEETEEDHELIDIYAFGRIEYSEHRLTVTE